MVFLIFQNSTFLLLLCRHSKFFPYSNLMIMMMNIMKLCQWIVLFFCWTTFLSSLYCYRNQTIMMIIIKIIIIIINKFSLIHFLSTEVILWIYSKIIIVVIIIFENEMNFFIHKFLHKFQQIFFFFDPTNFNSLNIASKNPLIHLMIEKSDYHFFSLFAR